MEVPRISSKKCTAFNVLLWKNLGFNGEAQCFAHTHSSKKSEDE